MKAVLCPVCNGTGVYQWPDTKGAFCPRDCHGCTGKGWVEVSDDVSYGPLPPRPGTLGYHVDIDECPGCGGKRTEPALTGCPPGSHYGPYCSDLSLE